MRGTWWPSSVIIATPFASKTELFIKMHRKIKTPLKEIIGAAFTSWPTEAVQRIHEYDFLNSKKLLHFEVARNNLLFGGHPLKGQGTGCSG